LVKRIEISLGIELKEKKKNKPNYNEKLQNFTGILKLSGHQDYKVAHIASEVLSTDYRENFLLLANQVKAYLNSSFVFL
jgi:hypothetical protein